MRTHRSPTAGRPQQPGTRSRRTGGPLGPLGQALSLLLLVGLFFALAAGCRTAGPVVRIEDSPHAYVVLHDTMIEAAQGKTVSTDAVNPRIQDNAVPVYSSGSATASRQGDTTDRTDRTNGAGGEPGESGGALPGG